MPVNKPKEIQTVILFLSDGRVVRYTGPEQVLDTDPPASVVNVAFVEGKDLPDGYYFEKVVDD